MDENNTANPQEEIMEDVVEENSAEELSEKNIEEGNAGTQINRGVQFRKELLERIPAFHFPDELKQEDFNLKTVLSPLFNLKAGDFIDQLKKIIPKEK